VFGLESFGFRFQGVGGALHDPHVGLSYRGVTSFLHGVCERGMERSTRRDSSIAKYLFVVKVQRFGLSVFDLRTTSSQNGEAVQRRPRI
jgi:hypothetical protein